jgi:hypothetical protein
VSFVRTVSLADLVDAMAGTPDDATFRYFETLRVDERGVLIHDEGCLRVTLGEARRVVREIAK